MRSKHSTGVVTALYRVFVAPAIPATRAAPLVSASPKRLPRPANRAFTTTHPQQAKTRAPEQRVQKWNEEIEGEYVFLVNTQTGELSNLRWRNKVLANLNMDTHRLVQVSEQPDGNDPESGILIPVCKIQSKKETYQREKQRKAQQKDAKKASAMASSVKTMELNWAIDSNDLGHRLERMKEFLGAGRKVEVVLAAKKAGRKANTAECEGVMKKIRDAVESVPGAREAKALHGKLGQFCTIIFQGKPPQVQAQTQSQTPNAGAPKAQQQQQQQPPQQSAQAALPG